MFALDAGDAKVRLKYRLTALPEMALLRIYTKRLSHAYKDPKMGIKLFRVIWNNQTEEAEIHTYLFPDKTLIMSQQDLEERVAFLKEKPEAKKECRIQMVKSQPITMWKLFLK